MGLSFISVVVVFIILTVICEVRHSALNNNNNNKTSREHSNKDLFCLRYLSPGMRVNVKYRHKFHQRYLLESSMNISVNLVYNLIIFNFILRRSGPNVTGVVVNRCYIKLFSALEQRHSSGAV